MLRSVNATTALLLACSLALPACRSSGGAPRSAPEAGIPPPAAPPADAGTTPPPAAGAAREESARFFPEPYGNLWIGEPLPEFIGDYPDAQAYVARGDPERLAWREMHGANGLVVRIGFVPGATPETTVLRSAQFMSLLPAPTNPTAPPTAPVVAAWKAWLTEAYGPLLTALRNRYGDRADVYSCGGGEQHPIVRIVWRGRSLAVTEAFMLHDKGLSSTLMITPLGVADRYIQATQCRWVQDEVL